MEGRKKKKEKEMEKGEGGSPSARGRESNVRECSVENSGGRKEKEEGEEPNYQTTTTFMRK